MTTNISGIYVAPFTPLNQDYSINFNQIKPYVERLIQAKVSGVFINGTTGEFASLTIDERKQLTEAWKQAAGDSLNIIVHVGSTCIHDSIDLSSHANTVGVNGFSAVAPFYFKPATMDALVETTTRIAAAAPDLPFYYYHIPSFTNVSYSMTDYLHKATGKISNLSGVKYSHTDLTDVQGCLTSNNGNHTVFFGVDEMLLGALAMGVNAMVGSTYNFAAPLYQTMITNFHQGDVEQARDQQSNITSMIRVIHKFCGLPALKAIMELTGLDCGPMRHPLPSMNQTDKELLRNELEQIGFFEFIST